MKDRQTETDESSTDRTSRRNALRLVAGTGATVLLGSLAGCEEEEVKRKLNPTGQTVVYKTTQDELREGTLSPELTDETVTPDSKTVVGSEDSVASVGSTRGRLSLSPDATEVAYVGAGGGGWGDTIAIQTLNGGDEKHSRSDLQGYWQDSIPNSITLGEVLSLDWCPTSGSDKIAVSINGRSELNGKLLFEFDRGSEEVKMFEPGRRPNMHHPNVAWSPTCDKIAYREESGPSGTNEPLTVWTVGNSTNTQRAKNGKDPAWGDTGIAFVRNGNVYLDRQSGSVQLTTSSATDSNPVLFEQGSGESLAFQRNNEIHLIERIDEFGSNPNPSVRKVETDRQVATFDISD